MKGVTATANSPRYDILPKLQGMRALSRDLFMNSPIACAILRRKRALDIGSGLQVQSTIDGDYLGLSPEETKFYEKSFEREFDLWAESTNSDFDRINSYWDNQGLAYINMLISGDFFFMPVWRKPADPTFPYELTIKLIDADLVRSPYGDDYGDQNIKGGIRYNSRGEPEAVCVWNNYDTDIFTNVTDYTWIPVYDSTGRQQIYQVFDPERISQGRGVPLLANVADTLKQLTRLSEAELMNALVSSFFTVFVKDASGLGGFMGPAMTPNETVTGGGRYGPGEAEVSARNIEDGNDLEMGHGNVTYLDEMKDVVIADPGKTDKNFDRFFEALVSTACAGAGMPIETAMMKYTTSYTAARAAYNDLRKHTMIARTVINRKFNGIVYKELLSESVIKSRLNPPGFFNDYATTRAWTRSRWVGTGQGALNPFIEAKAAVIDLNANLTNHEEQYLEKYGGRWDSTMVKRAGEEILLEELGLTTVPDPTELVGPDGQEDDAEE